MFFWREGAGRVGCELVKERKGQSEGEYEWVGGCGGSAGKGLCVCGCLCLTDVCVSVELQPTKAQS